MKKSQKDGLFKKLESKWSKFRAKIEALNLSCREKRAEEMLESTKFSIKKGLVG